jgi:hypothetical protein
LNKLSDEALRKNTEAKAYKYSRKFLWANVAKKYVKVSARGYIRLRSNCYINSNIIGLVMAPLPCKLKEKMCMNRSFLSKKVSSTLIVSFLVLAVFLAIPSQTLALKLSPQAITLTSPNPLAYTTYGVEAGMYGETVAYGGNYIFVSGEGNFYVYTAQDKALVKTIVGSTIAIGSGYVAIGDPKPFSTAV